MPTEPHDNQSDADTRPAAESELPCADPSQEDIAVIPSMPPVPDQPRTPHERKGPSLTDDNRFRSGRLKGLTMTGAIIALSWPVLTESFLNSLVGLVDTALSAGLEDGEAAADAIGGASYIMWLIGLVIMALGIGATALIARSFGKSRLAVAGTILGQTTTLALIAGVTVGILVWFGAPFMTHALNMSDAAAQYFRDYMQIIALGTPVATLLFGLIACSRGAGDSVSPLYAMGVRNIVNIAVSWTASGAEIFGYAPPLSLDMGVTGIAVGTVVGDFAGMLVILLRATSGGWSIRLRLKRMKPHWHTVRRIVRLGIPNFIETFGMWFGNFIIIFFVGQIMLFTATEGLLGSHMIAIRIEAFSFLPGFAMGTAAATLAGQYIGARRPDLAKRAVLVCTAVAASIMTTLGVVLIAFPHAITGALSQQPIHLDQVPKLLIICGIIQLPFALSIVFRTAMRGAGDVRSVMVLTWITTYLLRIPIAYISSGVDIQIPEWLGNGTIHNPGPFEPSLAGLWIGMCAELVLRGLIFTVYFLKGRWLNAKV